MKQITFDNMKVVVNLEDGETVSKDKPLNGKLVLDEEANLGDFTKNPKKEKTSTRNPIHYQGEYINVRLNKDSNFRFIMLLPYDTNVSEIRSKVCNDLNKALDAMPH